MRHAAELREADHDEGLVRAPAFASALYTGWVRHRRHAPHPHAFRYRLFMAYLDLAEVEQVFARRWLWSAGRRNVAEFRRSDYLGDPAIPLDQAVRDCVERYGAPRPSGPIRLLTHLRYFGKCFNPVSFYYCFAEDGHTLQTVIAEVTNTPWKERHAYVLPVAEATPHGDVNAWHFDKRLHVSPFMAMEHAYAWRFGIPGDALRVHMEVLPPGSPGDPGRREFDATLVLQRKPVDARHLAAMLMRFPLMTLQVVAAIHWQALRLWLRGNPVHDHPAKRTAQ
ncbi:MAG TPA: DUF1365 domain-containing protein [Pseudoxanthomonas sp.]|nr:DUF1365 domain-containing protein [Pseudoxanthomonas sp.]